MAFDLKRRLLAQFRRPEGILGRIAGWIMLWRPGNRARNDWALEMLELKPGQRVLELGCGPGWALARAAEKTPGGTVVGLDHSPLMRRTAARRLARAAGRGEVLLARLEEWAPPEGRFDRVFAVNSLQFIVDKAGLLRKIKEALAPGGRFVAAYEPRHPGAVDEDAEEFAREIQEAAAAAGLVVLKTEKRRFGKLLTAAVLVSTPGPRGA